jgi:hypothetical protein
MVLILLPAALHILAGFDTVKEAMDNGILFIYQAG